MKHNDNRSKVVVIGGGTGSFTLLSSLKHHPISITALVNMADNGGSTGVLRDELGVLPPGDVRQCLVALSQSPETLRELFNYRFPKGTFAAGHSFGNLFLSAFEMMSKDFGQAVELAEKVLNIKGKVLPITLDNCHLVIDTYAGTLKGEYEISQLNFEEDERPKLYLEPKADLSPKARQAILEADLVVIAPGNLYGSLAPALLVDGIGRTLRQTKAPIVYVANLVNKPHQTAGFAVHDYVDELERFIGGQAIDVVLYNNKLPSKAILNKYAVEGEYPIAIDTEILKRAHYKAIGGDFLSKQAQSRNRNDTFIKRSLIRHDGDVIAKAIMGLL